MKYVHGLCLCVQTLTWALMGLRQMTALFSRRQKWTASGLRHSLRQDHRSVSWIKVDRSRCASMSFMTQAERLCLKHVADLTARCLCVPLCCRINQHKEDSVCAGWSVSTNALLSVTTPWRYSTRPDTSIHFGAQAGENMCWLRVWFSPLFARHIWRAHWQFFARATVRRGPYGEPEAVNPDRYAHAD